MFHFRINLWWLATWAKPKNAPQHEAWKHCSILVSICGDCQHDAWKCSISGICGDCQCEAWQCSILGVCSDCQPGPSNNKKKAPHHEDWERSVSGICGDCQPEPRPPPPKSTRAWSLEMFCFRNLWWLPTWAKPRSARCWRWPAITTCAWSTQMALLALMEGPVHATTPPSTSSASRGSRYSVPSQQQDPRYMVQFGCFQRTVG